ncbi:MAG TPA: rubredoxin [Burkholderiales bacterium]|nr:rubredoxin [Burkholderiales bacterium]
MSQRKFTCQVCGHVYDEAVAGIRWEDLPADWVCPECGATKADFALAECALS